MKIQIFVLLLYKTLQGGARASCPPPIPVPSMGPPQPSPTPALLWTGPVNNGLWDLHLVQWFSAE